MCPCGTTCPRSPVPGPELYNISTLSEQVIGTFTGIIIIGKPPSVPTNSHSMWEILGAGAGILSTEIRTSCESANSFFHVSLWQAEVSAPTIKKNTYVPAPNPLLVFHVPTSTFAATLPRTWYYRTFAIGVFKCRCAVPLQISCRHKLMLNKRRF